MVDARSGARVVSVHAGPVRRFDDGAGRSWVSAIGKSALSGPVRVAQDSLTGDEQADRRHHGGPDKAVFVYPCEHYPRWREELGLSSVGPGAFGENLAVEGLTEDEVCLGDVWHVGGVVLQVSQPRRPCWKPARRWGVSDLVPRIQRSGRTGWYLRVLSCGFLQEGDAMVLRERPYPRWTVARVSHTMRAPADDLATTRALAECPALLDRWREELTRRLGRIRHGGEEPAGDGKAG
ncbi:MOSC domain-containing protein [Nocardiopsis kunsanensis]|uniref:Molybdenum cofactor biosysynthesis protein n=1 Tax=Nocardiopsis kunsanensis TaxID=141693 RepID=A0A918X9X0_9ACTN|nr:MOSC domain-containing protein [Nocardiopsis kunsanensis]GHD20505.1 molybdenum cofactor biosysynthesis protein [Nocardiopsis kunsanensis]